MRKRGGRQQGDDQGQLLMLAGVVLTLALLTSLLAASEIGDQEQRSKLGSPSAMPELFFATRDKVATTLAGLSYTGMSDGVLQQNIADLTADQTALAGHHSAQLVFRNASGTDTFAPKSELNFTSGGSYNAWSYNGSVNFASLAYDGTNDGILHDSTGTIKGAVLYLMMADASTRMDETFIVALN